ncbi:hypothetical protein KUV44_06620 [Marinobacter daepoensis]|uniref:DUF6160 domain-containing protein n=1 Tax=Marinobacter daepoensis TaxID=262077 RepID=A0ABS3BGP5_9GAMM|nr:DUF6160 family protein [Marinobacter daepoensis]MBN7770942.1 hypothetical protein [Marinobacter daepoensis]MBY6033288.1 hypothetical protein [Marinobacter daepoensis]MBY6078804.1 hypothetical protein [Marinobacter daepoensis]
MSLLPPQGRTLRACLGLIAGTSLAFPAMAEFQALDDATLSGVTGQAGVTIELETRLTIDHLIWTDEGSLGVNGLRLSGQNDTVLDNMNLTIDIAGTGEVLEHGFSEIARRANAGLLDTSNPDVADALARYSVGGSFGRQFDNGDLVIHLGASDYGDPASLTDYLQAVDFELAIDSITTQGSEGSASLFSNILLQGYLGPTDLVIRNEGNATRTLANGNTVSSSELQLDTHFEISNGSLNWDAADVILLFNFAAVGIEGLQIHNRRGADTLGHFGMAHARASLSRGTSSASGKEGLSVHEVEFRGDIDMPVFRMGDTSIGSVQFTDFAITNTTLMVYGH